MTVGFTGTRARMSPAQLRQLAQVLEWLGPSMTFHHGGAVGADRQAAAEANCWLPPSKIIVHPAGPDPLARNRALVAVCDVLIAAPRTNAEELRSGTWATVRYARAKGIPIVFLSR